MIQNLLEETKKWSHKNNDLDSLLLVGSYARNKAHRDSDIDLVLILKLKRDKISDEKGMLAAYSKPMDFTKKENIKELLEYVRSLR